MVGILAQTAELACHLGISEQTSCNKRDATTMLGKRRFITSPLCAAGGVPTAPVGVRPQAPGFTRTVLTRVESPGEKMIPVQVLVKIEPNVLVARHTHPGV